MLPTTVNSKLAIVANRWIQKCFNFTTKVSFSMITMKLSVCNNAHNSVFRNFVRAFLRDVQWQWHKQRWSKRRQHAHNSAIKATFSISIIHLGQCTTAITMVYHHKPILSGQTLLHCACSTYHWECKLHRKTCLYQECNFYPWRYLDIPGSSPLLCTKGRWWHWNITSQNINNVTTCQ